MSTDWHVARNSCAGTAAHSTRLPQQRRQRRGTAAALDSCLALWNQGVLCLASLSQGALRQSSVNLDSYMSGTHE